MGSVVTVVMKMLCVIRGCLIDAAAADVKTELEGAAAAEGELSSSTPEPLVHSRRPTPSLIPQSALYTHLSASQALQHPQGLL